jgi:ribosomal protein S18 acetylase RimI-like enzyme
MYRAAPHKLLFGWTVAAQQCPSQGTFVIEYRSFRNTDPPGLAEVWNDALTGRASVRLRNSSPLERFTFSKLYFDPAGLILALEEGRCVGFVHAGFGSNPEGTALDMQSGVTCVLVVRTTHRRRGIGSELLRRAEGYLRGRGAQHLYAGPLPPRNAFYLGLYGGSDLPGFLVSDRDAEPFLTRRGYQPYRGVRVLQRRTAVAVKGFDARFVSYRQRFELLEDFTSRLGSWWQYCMFNGAEPRVFLLLDRGSGERAAQATVWEMEGFSYRWNMPAIGVLDWQVRPDLQRQGVGKFLLAQLLRKAQEELVDIMELQVPEDNEPAWKTCKALGFEQVDLGRCYQLSTNS